MAKMQHAFNCYTSHFGNSNNHSNIDIKIAKDNVPEHDLLVGGFPCQDYSVARTGANGIEGKKGVLWWSIKDIIDNKEPVYILLENVDRLIKSPSKQRGRDFGIILRSLYDKGYAVEWRIINAADYGYSQRRRRTFIFAFKNDKKIDNLREFIETKGFFAKLFHINGFNFKKRPTEVSITKNEFGDLKEFSDKFQAKFYNAGIMFGGKIYSAEIIPKLEAKKALSDLVEKNGVDDKYLINGTLEKFQYLKGSKKIKRIKPNGELYIYSVGSMSFPDKMDEPARTMLTSKSSVNRSTHVILDPKTGKYRLLTPKECERINGFDDNWTDTRMPEKFRYFCMGNALVVSLVERMGEGIAKLWK
jgi:DNA (cytosine-5)-methyltransferase 1